MKKMCSQKPHYLATKYLKQLIHNYAAITPWKYEKLRNKIPCQKIWSSIVVTY